MTPREKREKSMSLPNIPNITPDITLSRCETLNLLLSSVAMEEIGLSHILQAEAERIQMFLGASGDPSLEELSSINRSTERLISSPAKRLTVSGSCRNIELTTMDMSGIRKV